MLDLRRRAARGGARPAPLRRRRLIAALLALVVVLIGIGGVALAHLARSSKHGKRSTLAGRPRPPLQPPRPSTPPSDALAAIDAIGNANIRRLTALALPVYCGGPHGNEVAFTFDDGPGVYTHFALAKLTEAHERATFFVVGRSIDAWPGWLPKELAVGAIGDHTYTHPELTALSPAAVTSQLASTKAKIEAQTGQPVDLFRPPYGARSPTVDGIARRLGLLEIMWSVDSQDSLGADWTGVINNVEAGLRPGAIILMHENHGQTIRALSTLLPELRRRHLRSVSLPELFASDPPSVAQVRAGEAACFETKPISPSTG